MASLSNQKMDLINRALLKEQLKRFWVIAAIPTLGYLLTVVLPLYRGFDNNNSYINTVSQLMNLLEMRNLFMLFTSIVLPMTAALALNSHLFRPRAAVAFSSFPLNRKQLFFTNLAAGAILLIAPLIILCLFILIPIRYLYDTPILNGPYSMSYSDIPVSAVLYPNGVANGQILNTVPVVAMFFLRTAVTFMFYFAIFTLASIVAGHGIVAAFLCCAFPLIPLCAFGIDQTVKYWMTVGFNLSSAEDLISRVALYSNAVCWNFSLRSSYLPAKQMPPDVPFNPAGIVYIVITLALFALAYWCNRARRQERTGESVVFNGLKQVLIFLLSFGGGIIMFIFTVNIFNNMTIAYGGFVLGFIVAFFIAQMIAEKTFNVGHKLISLFKFGAVMAGIFLTVFVSTRFDVNGFQHYVPNENEVRGVFINSNFSPANMETDENSEWIYDREIIARTIDAHKRTLTNMNVLRKTLESRITGMWSYNGENVNTQRLYYLMNDGSYVMRDYLLTGSLLESTGWKPIMEDEQVILSAYALLTKPETVNRVYIQVEEYIEEEDTSASAAASADFKTTTYKRYYVTDRLEVDNREDIASLFEAMRRDVITFARAQHTDVTQSITEGNFNAEIHLEENLNDREIPIRYVYGQHSENTKRWLQGKGYEIRRIE